MSETPQETEVVSGVIGGITQRAADKWQVAVTPAGSQYAKNLWTKDQALVGALSSRIGQDATFTCNVSHWTNNEGKNVRSLWISGEGAAPAVTAPSSGQSTPQVYEKLPAPEVVVDWDEKERRAIRSKAWAHTISLLGPHVTFPVGENISAEQSVTQMISRLKLTVELIYVDICRSHDFAHPNLGADVAFGDESSVPFD